MLKALRRARLERLEDASTALATPHNQNQRKLMKTQLRITYITILARDLDAAFEWYSPMLGFERRQDTFRWRTPNAGSRSARRASLTSALFSSVRAKEFMAQSFTRCSPPVIGKGSSL